MNKREDNRLGEYLRALRTSLGLSQEYVASILNVRRQTYSHYETGRIIPPSQTMVVLSRIFKVPVEDLLILTSINDSENDDYLPEYSERTQPMLDMTDYIAYINTPVNISRLRFLGESEKRLLYYYSILNNDEKHDLIDFLQIKIRRKLGKS